MLLTEVLITMRLTEVVKLIPPGDDPSFDVHCHPLSIRGSIAEEAGVLIPLGGLQLVIRKHEVDEDWLVKYKGRSYEVMAVLPYIKRRVPQREVIICGPVKGDVESI